MRFAICIAVVFGIGLATPATAQKTMSGHSMTQGASQGQSAPLADGEIRKVDREAKKLTIKHGPIANLDMPPMTMVFQVKDPALLEKVKAGDKIMFRAEKIGSAYTATHIEAAK